MVDHVKGMHHYHTRKRIHKKHESYPSKNKWKRIMDKVILGVAVAGPIMTIPQLLKIWVEKNATGVSVISWAAYLVLSVFWLIYGVMHKEKPIIFSSVLWIILQILIVIGILIY